MLGRLDPPGFPGALGTLGAPGAGVPIMFGAGMGFSGSKAPHSGHVESVGSQERPQEGQTLSIDTAAGLKHILTLLFLFFIAVLWTTFQIVDCAHNEILTITFYCENRLIDWIFFHFILMVWGVFADPIHTDR